MGESYHVRHREPTDPEAQGIDFGISLVDSDDRHRGWVKEESRAELDKLLLAGRTDVVVTVARLGRKWSKFDPNVGEKRYFRVGEAVAS
jgi:hypothetical protein